MKKRVPEQRSTKAKYGLSHDLERLRSGEVKTYHRVTAGIKKLRLEQFIRRHVLMQSPIAMALGEQLGILNPYVEAVLNQGQPSVPGALSPAEKALAGARIQSGLPIPLQLGNGRLTLNEALRRNRPYLFNKTLQTVNDPESAMRLNQRDQFGLTAFHTAVLTRRLPQAKALLSRGANPFVKNQAGESALDHLANYGQIEPLNALLDRMEKTGEPLLWKKHKEEAEELKTRAQENNEHLEAYVKEAKQLSSNDRQRNFYELTISEVGDDASVEKQKGLQCLAFIKAGADVEKADILGNTPLIWAVRRGNLEMVNALIEGGADANKADEQEQTPLMWAAIHGNLEIASLLIQAGADVHKTDRSGRTPIRFVVDRGIL